MTTTIPQLKQQFLSGQVRILNAPLEPPQDWRDTVPAAQSGNLSNSVVEGVLAKANRILRAHNANCFPPMVLEHVAAQIDALYWSQTTTPAVLEGKLDDADGVLVDADLCDDSVIASLPRTVPAAEGTSTSSPGSRSLTQRSVLESDDLATRYARLLRSLQRLSAQRKAAEQRVAQARGLLELLAPLKDPGRNVQGNLVVEDGELVAELTRMRDLLARVRAGFP